MNNRKDKILQIAVNTKPLNHPLSYNYKMAEFDNQGPIQFNLLDWLREWWFTDLGPNSLGIMKMVSIFIACNIHDRSWWPQQGYETGFDIRPRAVFSAKLALSLH